MTFLEKYLEKQMKQNMPKYVCRRSNNVCEKHIGKDTMNVYSGIFEVQVLGIT